MIKDRIKSTKEKLSNPQNDYGKRYKITDYILFFFVFSFIGWIWEVCLVLVQTGKLVNRGVLFGPWLPIYGSGGVLILLLLRKVFKKPVITFFSMTVLCTIIEYFTSWYLEVTRGVRWWDYSNYLVNINGRVCLGTIVPFGLLGLFIMYVLNPFFLGQIGKLSEMWLNILFWSLLAIYICDNVISGIVVRAIKTTEKGFGKELDNTEEITNKVKDILRQKSILHRRLINAYPKIQAVKFKIKEKKQEIKKYSEEIQNNIEEKSNLIKEQIEQKSNKLKEKIKNEDLKKEDKK